ncbi:MAG: glycosyltransferase family 2 protein [Chordicoccus sp.]
MDILYIVVPAYNEAANIRQLIDGWYPVVEKHNGDGLSRLVVVNDGSRDETYEILKELAKTRPLLQPLTKPNGGHGAAVLFGYRYALEQEADFIFQTDSDGQTDPREFEKFWRHRKGYEAIFGNRTARGDGKDRAFVERTLCAILRIMFGVRIPDANAPFRLMKADYVARYIQLIPENYNLPNVMLTTLGRWYHEKIVFVPISFKPRQGGTNSINLKKIVRIGWKALGDFAEIRRSLT